MCTDMKPANTAINRERFEMPNLENIIHKANNMKWFAKIDLSKAFEQISLHKDSRYISRSRTHIGIFQHKLLFYRKNTAPEIFHELIRKLLNGKPNAQNETDDFLCMSETEDGLYTTVLFDLLFNLIFKWKPIIFRFALHSK